MSARARKKREVGVLHLSSKQRHGFTKKGVPFYRFTAYGARRATSGGDVKQGAVVETVIKVGYRRAHEHKFRDVYAIVEDVCRDGAASRACLVEILGELGNYEAGMLAIQYAHVGYKRPRLRAAVPAAPAAGGHAERGGASICCTIDPPGCADADDALSFCAVPPPGGCSDGAPAALYRVGVSITDVDAVVAAGTGVDAYYREQPVSLYRPDGRVAHALPEQFSTDVCSLRAGERRPVLSVHFCVGADGVLRGEPRVVREEIRSEAQLTYDEANARFEGTDPAVPAARAALWRLFGRVLRRWIARCEVPVLQGCDAAHRAVEFLMIKANEHVARALQKAVHDGRADVVLLREHVAAAVAATADDDGEKRPAHALEGWRSCSAARYVAYSAETAGRYAGHAGLGLAAYTHFTSPIRRYADLVVHRMVKRHVLRDGPGEEARRVADGLDLPRLAQHLNGFARVAHRAACEWHWWHHCLGDASGESVCEYHGVVLDWQCEPPEEGSGGALCSDAVVLLVRITRRDGGDGGGGGGADDKAADSAARASPEALRDGKLAWIPLFHRSAASALRVTQADASLEVRRTEESGRHGGACLRVRAFQYVALRCWWDMRRGVRGRSFLWHRPDVGAFLTASAVARE